MSCLNKTSRTHTYGRFGPTLICLIGEAAFPSASFTTTAALKEFMELPGERKDLSNWQTTLVTCVSRAAQLPVWLTDAALEKGRWFVICTADEPLHLLPPSPMASLWIPTFPSDTYRLEDNTRQAEQHNVSFLPQDGFTCGPQAPLFSPAPISLPTHLHPGELNSSCF